MGLAALNAYRWHDDLVRDKVKSAKDIADKEKVCEQFVQARLNLALLSPEIIESLIESPNNSGLNLEMLKNGNFAMAW